MTAAVASTAADVEAARAGGPARRLRQHHWATPDQLRVPYLLELCVFILGPDKGMALIERLPDVEGVIVTSKNEVLVSSGLKGKLLMLATPTDAP